MELIDRLDNWFIDRLQNLRCSENARAYVIGLLSSFKLDNDMSNLSIVMAYYDARTRSDFVSFQRIGDWVLWVSALHPNHVQNNSEIIESLGRLSYYSCHRMMRGKWNLYEELADDLPRIARNVRCKLDSSYVIFDK